MLALVVAGSLLAASPEPVALTGNIVLQGPSFARTVMLRQGKQPRVRLEGELVSELRNLQSVEVEVVGRWQSDNVLGVKEYRILDIGGGVRPLVGILERGPNGPRLRDGDGEPIPLSLSPRAAARLDGKEGAKIWVHGKRLVSGELKVTRHGIIRLPKPPPKKPPVDAQR